MAPVTGPQNSRLSTIRFADACPTKIPWAHHLGDIVLAVARRQKWSSILVGGCCKASAEDIRNLAQYIRQAEGQS